MKRASGILMHISSLPSPHGVGDLGPEARRFVDQLEKAGQTYWQILPLTPTDQAFGNSPYSSFSAFAGNPLFISPELLVRDGLLETRDLPPACPESARADYPEAYARKAALLEKAYAAFKKNNGVRDAFEAFCREQANWLEDHARFVAFKARFKSKGLVDWPEDVKHRRAPAVDALSTELGHEIEKHKFFQFLFFGQWNELKLYANRKGVKIIGDVPIYVNGDSADLWANPAIFKLDRNLVQLSSAGVPPDYFSKTGQLWGNPVYDWDKLRQTGFAWWLHRLEQAFSLYDLARIDHFRGFCAYWEVPAGEKTAINGRWVDAPVREFFATLLRYRAHLPIIAEDLGVITPDVREVMRYFNFPGLKVLMFAFGQDLPKNPYIPHNVEPNSVMYTGTHDNNTVRGWFESEATEVEKTHLARYLGKKPKAADVHQDLIRLAMSSVSDLVVCPMQDVLGLDAKSRMNTPSTAEGDWLWRLLPGQFTDKAAEELCELTRLFGRC